MTTLARLLPQLNASDADLLDVDQRACLYTTLTRSHCNRHTEYVLSVIMALEQIGDADALPHIERLTSFRAKTSAEQRVQEAARECLTYLQAHDNRRRESRTLLRAASATETPSDVLLRPASGTAESNPEELLRPSDVEARSQAQD